MTRKLSPNHISALGMIADVGGSFLPEPDADPSRIRLLRELARWGYLRAEPNDTAFPRFHLTEQGRNHG